MNKIIKSVLTLSMVAVAWFSTCLWIWWGWENNPDTKFPYWTTYQKNPKTEIWDDVDIKNKDGNSIITRLLDVFNLNIDRESDHKFLDYVRAILNVALGLLSMVALIMTIYTFYLMFFTENEAWAKKAKWNLVGIFIALAIIWLAWLIVSFIFRWYQKNWENNMDYIKEVSMVNHELKDNSLNSHVYLNV